MNDDLVEVLKATPPGPVFEPFAKIARLSRNCVITEKIDGTNGQIYIGVNGEFAVGSRNRWLTPESDNFGFAKWAYRNRDELLKLGPGRHYGEWWGNGIQRGYGLPNGDKRFSLFNAGRWGNNPDLPACVSVVPVLYGGAWTDTAIDLALAKLRAHGSVAAPGFINPEGIVVFHSASKQLYKKTLDGDALPKSVAA